MARPGYLYVLSSAALLGLFKVGCTTRSPHIRARELSRPTGLPLPMPFIVEHFVFVPDMALAETALHQLLERRGYRFVTNREFFTAPLDVIKTEMNTIQKSLNDLALKELIDGFGAIPDEPDDLELEDWDLLPVPAR